MKLRPSITFDSHCLTVIEQLRRYTFKRQPVKVLHGRCPKKKKTVSQSAQRFLLCCAQMRHLPQSPGAATAIPRFFPYLSHQWGSAASYPAGHLIFHERFHDIAYCQCHSACLLVGNERDKGTVSKLLVLGPSVGPLSHKFNEGSLFFSTQQSKDRRRSITTDCLPALGARNRYRTNLSGEVVQRGSLSVRVWCGFWGLVLPILYRFHTRREGTEDGLFLIRDSV